MVDIEKHELKKYRGKKHTKNITYSKYPNCYNIFSLMVVSLEFKEDFCSMIFRVSALRKSDLVFALDKMLKLFSLIKWSWCFA